MFQKQRTVYRMTLVKGFNIDDLGEYAKLVALGHPDFIEIKGVTYCGEAKGDKANSLTMANVPWHEEVTDFVSQLADLLPDYEIASEHEHSNCLLLANTKFKIDGRWHTWIDYDKFHELVDSGEPFEALDYVAPTPHWAVFGAKERGFDPEEIRWSRKNKGPKDITGC